MFAERALADEIGGKVKHLRSEGAEDNLGKLGIEFGYMYECGPNQCHRHRDVELSLGRSATYGNGSKALTESSA